MLWCILQISDWVGGLVEFDLIFNFNEFNVLGDVSWVKLFKYLGVWWLMYLDNESWVIGLKYVVIIVKICKVIDFVVVYGFCGVFVEGWNFGWDGNWVGNGYDFDFICFIVDFDIEVLVVYGVKKGVYLIGYYEIGCVIEYYEDQFGVVLDLYVWFGVDVFKSGYVCDDGQVDWCNLVGGLFWCEWYDGQFMVCYYLKVVQEVVK